MKIVFPLSSGSAASPDGSIIAFRCGEPWDESDPFVAMHRDLFSSEPAGAGFPRRTVRAVEQATAAPGEHRGFRRTR